MTTTLHPQVDRPALPQPPAAAGRSCGSPAVQWFGASHRLTPSGEPDSRYGWLATPMGPCIVKAMDPRLVAHNQTLLDHERQMFTRLAELKAPVPALMTLGGPDWLVTRFAGISLARAAHPGGLQQQRPLGATEQLAAWIHTLRALHPLADQGVLVIDLYDANIVLPLTEGTHGQLRLHQPVLIDHAHTLAAGIDMRRPVWLNREMARIAPELRDALAHDQGALLAQLEAAGAARPRYSHLPGEQDELGRQVWAAYDANQRLQQQLDSAAIEPHRAMQYAAGVEVHRLVQRHALQEQAALMGVLQRMKAADPAARFASLQHAAEALAQAVGRVPRVSERRLAALKPEDLAMPKADTGPTHRPATKTPMATKASTDTTSPPPANTPAPTPTPNEATELVVDIIAVPTTALPGDGPAQQPPRPMAWWWAGLATLGAFTGALASSLGVWSL